MEGARGDEEDMVGLHRPVLGRHRGALDQRQQVALHAFAADIGALALGACADLVDLVEEDDAVVLHRIDGLLHDLLLVEELVGFLGDQHLVACLDGHAPRLGAAAKGLAQHVGEIDHAAAAAGHAGNVETRHAAGIGHLDLDLLGVEFAATQFLAEDLAGRLRCIGADQRFDHAGFGIELGLGLDVLALGRP